jgi:hypothetical protein
MRRDRLFKARDFVFSPQCLRPLLRRFYSRSREYKDEWRCWSDVAASMRRTLLAWMRQVNEAGEPDGDSGPFAVGERVLYADRHEC